ncbi:MAG TPA: PQQ-binding-like beta-propeller repeat protein [Pirellulales bacterium]|nr:PQQ-binding-like beta-propeller repeat protein [Pirellulales bacterium]
MEEAHTSPDDAPASARRISWLPPVVIGLLGGALVAVIRTLELFQENAAYQNLATLSALGLTLILLAFWAIFFTGASGSVRAYLLFSGLALVGGFLSLVRVEGVSGDILPKLAWRWTPKADERLADEIGEGGKPADATIDLTATTDRDFPQFLGPARDARLNGPRLARDWQARPPKELWRQPIGAGWSSFAVVGPYAVTQEQRGDNELVSCYEILTGKLLWAHVDPGRFNAVIAGDGPRATPTIADGLVYALGANGRLDCLDGASGEVVWTHDVLAENSAPNLEWGKSCSPAIIGDLIVVSAGGPDDHSLVAYDKASGKEVWHGGDDPSSYSSPVLAELAGVEQILIVNHHALAAHDPTDGRVLWRYQWTGDQPKVAQPVIVGRNQVLIGSGYGIGCMLLEIERSDDGELSCREAWKSHSRKLKPKFTNVVLHDGHVYGIDDGRTLVCIELKRGDLKWRGGRYGHGQLLLVDDLLLVQSETGEVALVEASPERFTELTRFHAIDGKCWNTPALAGPYLLVRNAEKAACYELPLEGEE